jgi:hypothetical protein
MDLIKSSLEKLLILVCLLTISAGAAASASAQDSTPVSNPRATHIFGDKITFEADLQTETEFTAAYLTFQTTGSNQSIVLPAERVGDTLLQTEFDITNQNPMSAFSQLSFWFTLEFSDGSQVQSEMVDYLFSDNRYAWQFYQVDENSDIHFVEGDPVIVQAVKDVIHQHRADFGRYLDLPYPDGLDIYIYPTISTFQSALELSNLSWAAGHANPDQNTILMAIPAGFDQQLDIQRQVPHEITHIRLSLYLDGKIEYLPAWFNEGIASLAESFTAPEYWQILQTAYQNDTLIPLEDLCDSFPYYSEEAALAYAESESFVRYLETRFGKAGLQSLLAIYKNGEPCQNGVTAALGSNLDRLEADWYKVTFDSSLVPRSVGAILAWVLLLVILFAAPIGLVLLTNRRKGK